MTKPQNAMEIFALLDRSNCRQCGKPTCLAFAGAVFTGQIGIERCPKLPPEVTARYARGVRTGSATEPGPADDLQKLQDQIATIDLAAAARRIGARFTSGRLTLPVLGKPFSVDANGRLSADIHINPWVAVPFLLHVLKGKGTPPSGNWVSYRELADARARHALFEKRCEAVLKRLADTYTDLFDDLVHLFSARRVAPAFASDISVLLHPLPLVSVMICYWGPDDGLTSSLHVFFDRTADDNLGADAVFTLGTGLAQMFEKLSIRHGLLPGNGLSERHRAAT